MLACQAKVLLKTTLASQVLEQEETSMLAHGPASDYWRDAAALHGPQAAHALLDTAAACLLSAAYTAAASQCQCPAFCCSRHSASLILTTAGHGLHMT